MNQIIVWVPPGETVQLQTPSGRQEFQASLAGLFVPLKLPSVMNAEERARFLQSQVLGIEPASAPVGQPPPGA